MSKLFKFLPIISIFILNLVSCSNSDLPYFELDENLNYDDFYTYKLDNIKNMYDKDFEEYAIYLYRSDCPSCNEIKNSMLGYFTLASENKVKLQVFHYSSVSLKKDYPSFNNGINFNDEKEAKEYMLSNNVNNIENTIFKVVPSLYVIKNKVLSDYYIGLEIPNYLFSNFVDSSYY